MSVELTAKVRTETGKGPARRLRQQNWIPAICYGPKAEPLALSVPENLLAKCLREMGEESRLIPLVVDHDGKTERKQVMIRELQLHPYKHKVIHLDFHEVPLDEPIAVDVPLELMGEPVGVEKGGMLNQIRHTLSIRCLPTEIPEKLTLDVSGLDVGESIHISDLEDKYPFELLDEGRYTVVTVAAPAGEAAEEAAEEGAELESTEGGEEVTEA
ncbi:large subunit ribosomal protein L25 [Desulfacinum hydrothermale DSM 13146]|uniref:Large ribosomal subunit protein bL25 n=1 Tax=Desulfacinum hydrothermale DSM 13146 TaxID=1121390 RepID=A0A1W1XDQ9_9BACT|nr:50S ribosomal protein L25/general stress protein Ctc [Desulfacinum hydrothermale]SMC21788.1 large subunit ribosomal protein L25 [Desulfacinum hydrothermale DSM 13146]